jgi:hypothetical protein
MINTTAIRRVLEGLNIAESEFARSYFTAMGELTLNAINLEARGLPRAAIAVALFAIAEKWAASGPHALPMERLVSCVADRFPWGSPTLSDLEAEYANALKERAGARRVTDVITGKGK